MNAPLLFLKNARAYFILMIVLVALDQATKLLILQYLQEYESIPILPFFNLVLVFNTGAAFSFLADAGGWQNTFFITVALLATGLLLWMFYQSHHVLERTALMMILSGALGNLIDRIYLNKVVDFLDFHAMGYHFPAFNVADSAITLGVTLLIILNLFFTTPSKKNES